MSAGDHVVVNYGVFTHHGIDVGDGTVVHWSRGNGHATGCRAFLVDWHLLAIRRTRKSCFAGGRRVRVVDHRTGFRPNQVVQRALSRVGERGYDLVSNNCEHFAVWCKTGRHLSQQTRRLHRMRTRVVTKASFIHANKTAVYRIQKAGTKALKGGSLWFLLADVGQTITESIAANSGTDPELAKLVGRAVGLGGSVIVGGLVGGPCGSIGAALAWLGGETVGEVGEWITS